MMPRWCRRESTGNQHIWFNIQITKIFNTTNFHVTSEHLRHQVHFGVSLFLILEMSSKSVLNYQNLNVESGMVLCLLFCIRPNSAIKNVNKFAIFYQITGLFFCYRVNNCVSYINYKYFILFLLYAELYCLFIAFTDLKYFVTFWKVSHYWSFVLSVGLPVFV